MNTASLDIEQFTAVPTLSGSILKGKHFVRSGGLSQAFKNTLVLQGPTQLTADALAKCKAASIGTGSVGYGEVNVLTIRLQIDGHQLYWLADPEDEDVWRMLRSWRNVGAAVIALNVLGVGLAALKVPAAGIGQVAQANINNADAASAAQVMEAIGAQITSGSLVANARSDIPEFPSLSRVEVLVLMSRRMERFILERGNSSGGFHMKVPAAIH